MVIIVIIRVCEMIWAKWRKSYQNICVAQVSISLDTSSARPKFYQAYLTPTSSSKVEAFFKKDFTRTVHKTIILPTKKNGSY